MVKFFNFIGSSAKIFNELTDIIAWSSLFIKRFSADNSAASKHTEKVLKVRHPLWQLLVDGTALFASSLISLGDQQSFEACIKLYNICKVGWYCKSLYHEIVSSHSDNPIIIDDGIVVNSDLCVCLGRMCDDSDYKKVLADLDNNDIPA